MHAGRATTISGGRSYSMHTQRSKTGDRAGGDGSNVPGRGDVHGDAGERGTKRAALSTVSRKGAVRVLYRAVR